MQTISAFRGPLVALIAAIVVCAASAPAEACTRALYVSKDGTVIVGRSMDWGEDMHSNMWVLPRGMQRDGRGGKNTISWVSKYGSLITSAYDIGTADGMNERGLVVNELALVESDYGTPPAGATVISLSTWPQYVLDNFATVAEAVEALRKEPFYIVTVATPDGHAGTAHLSLSDPSGDSAIFEYVKGKLVIHHGKDYKVMTNSPTYDQQLALDTYWRTIGGQTMLPGTNRAADRFVRASYYMDSVKKTDEPNEALATALSVIRNVSVPVGISTPGQPNIAATQWRTMSDHKNKVYYFESAFSPYLLAVNLAKLDFAEGAPTRKLSLTEKSALLVDGNFVSGEVSRYFVPTPPFRFLSPTGPAK